MLHPVSSGNLELAEASFRKISEDLRELCRTFSVFLLDIKANKW
jgi:hypothetical protein